MLRDRRATWRLMAVGALVGASSLVGTPVAAAPAYDITWYDPSQRFTYTVPANVCAITFFLRGGSGGTGRNPGSYMLGGYGGEVSASFPVRAGWRFDILVGQAGESSTNGGLSGGYRSGGARGTRENGVAAGGPGGGASMVIDEGAILVAGGGGGAGDFGSGADRGLVRGGSGGPAGSPGVAGGGLPGGGGTSTRPGPGGGYGGAPGNGGTGGAGATTTTTLGAGGGGGGGWYGGGGGGVGEAGSYTGAGGGGGSNFIASGLTAISNTTATVDQAMVGANLTPCTPATPPDAPGIRSADTLDRGVRLLVSSPDDNGSAITGYEIDKGDGFVPLTLDGTGRGDLTGLTPEQTYQLRVRAKNAAGAGAPSNPLAFTAATTPGAPTGVTATAGNRQATVSFSAAPPNGRPVTAYELFDDSDTLVTAFAGTSTTVGELTNGRTYRFKVRGANPVGAGAFSDYVEVTPRANRPGAPTGLTAVAAPGAAALTFTPPADDGGSAITGYEVRTGDDWAPLTVATAGSTRTALVTGLTGGDTYDIEVRAVNEAGAGAAATVTVAPLPVAPGPPTGLAVQRADGSVTLSYTPPAGAVTGYEYRFDGFESPQPLDASGVIGNLTGGVEYVLRLRAVNLGGAGPWSEPLTFTALSTPGAPQNVAAAAGDASATVTFTPGPANGGDITAWQLSVDGGAWAPVSPTGDQLRTLSLGGLTNGRTYAVRLRALNAAGAGTGSAPVSFTPVAFATPGSGTPDAPTDLDVKPGDTELYLTFTPPGSGVISYEVSVDDGVEWAPLDTVAEDDGTRTGIVDSLVNGTEYRVRVRAVNEEGAGTPSEAVPGTPAAPSAEAPAAPTAVEAVAGTASIRVSWEASDGASGYTATAAPGPAACTVESATSCVLGAVAGTTYTVTVVAHSEDGDSDPSEPSAPVTPRLPEAPATPPAGSAPLTTDDGPLAEVRPGQRFTVIGDGYAPHSTVLVSVYSEPTVLGRAVAVADGSFSLAVTLPAGLAAGNHTIVAQGVDPDGEPYASTMAVVVQPSGGSGGGDPPAGRELPRTGGGPALPGLLLILSGGLLLAVTRRPAPRPALPTRRR